MLKHLKPMRFPPLLMDVCVGKGRSFGSLFSSLPQVCLPKGPFQVSKVHIYDFRVNQMYVNTLGLLRSFLCLYTASSRNMFVSNSTKTSGYLSWATGPPLHFWKFTSAVSLGINTTPKSWSPLPTEGEAPSNQVLYDLLLVGRTSIPAKLGQSEVECEWHQTRMPQIPILLTPSSTT